MKTKFLVYVPFTGLGLYGGFRGNRWLKNRIKVFEQFVIPSLLNQTDQDFVLWVGWRPEEKTNKNVIELEKRLRAIDGLKVVFTFGGLCFWDDKYDDVTARDRLVTALKRTIPDLLDITGGADNVIMLLQPSDDMYHKEAILNFKSAFEKDETAQVLTFKQGYIMNYTTKEVLEYNPNTNPPFFAIKFPRNTFIDPGKHINYTGPYKSHEYIGEKLKLAEFEGRGFLVGTHGENISTHFNHPFGGRSIEGDEKVKLLDDFGVRHTPALRLKVSVRKWIMRQLPYNWQRKLRFLLGEMLFARFYNWIRN